MVQLDVIVTTIRVILTVRMMKFVLTRKLLDFSKSPIYDFISFLKRVHENKWVLFFQNIFVSW
jgi:hypothetical protein